MEPLVQNTGTLTWPPRSISLISVQAPTKLNTKHLYQPDAADVLLSGIIPLTVDHKIDHKYPKLLKTHLLNTEHNTIHIPRKTTIGNLQPIEIEDFEVSNISWTTDCTADTTNSPMEFPSMLVESSFQPEHNNTKHSIVLQDAQILMEAKDELSSLLKGDYNSIISKSPTDVGRTNLFQMDNPTSGTTHCMQTIPNSTKVLKVHHWGSKVIRKCRLHI